MEAYITFITNLADEVDERQLQPVFGISRQWQLTERFAENLAGYRGMGPVRVGNQAYEQVQYDVYGSIVLAAVHLFYDRRLLRKAANEQLFHKLERFGELAAEAYDKPDAGPWELRGTTKVHTFSSVMCWAACDRLARIARVLGHKTRERHWAQTAKRMRDDILEKAWRPELNSFASAFEGNDLDATALLMPQLGIVTPDDPRFIATVDRIGRDLKHGDFIYRYTVADDFGYPETAFTICTFWYVDALAAIGRRDEARALFDKLLTYRTPLGFLSEDIDPKTGELWGNFPQTYSMVGMINSAVNLSQSWEEAS